MNTINEATLITLSANVNSNLELEEFLKTGAGLVKKSEPNTKLWYALKENSNTFAIFDAFPNESAREEHFNGVVAASLKDQSKKLIQGGWETGVLQNVNNFRVLSSKLNFNNHYQGSEATYIKIRAADKQEKALESLLTAAAAIVAESEPRTLFWAALKLDAKTFAIFDTFIDQAGREQHFAGKVASLLKEQSSVLVEGGWDNGVLPNIHNYTIVAQI